MTGAKTARRHSREKSMNRIIASFLLVMLAGAPAAHTSQAEAPPAPTPPQTTTTSSTASLPCNSNVLQVNSVTYYQCGNTYYLQAYGGSGPIYMPVPPPA